MSPKVNDLTGQRFGRLEVLRWDGITGRNHGKWYVCRCDCGQEKTICGHYLRNGATRSCGCLVKERAREIISKRWEGHQKAEKASPSRQRQTEFAGQRYGLLTVIKRAETPKESIHALRTSWWLCKCDCGRETIRSREYLKASRKPSCGCVLTQIMQAKARRKNEERAAKRKENLQIPENTEAYGVYECPQCGKKFDTYGCVAWGWKHNGRNVCSWSCVRKAEQADKRRSKDD